VQLEGGFGNNPAVDLNFQTVRAEMLRGFIENEF